MSDVFDLIVIGGGSAGYAAAATATEAGMSVAVIEGGAEIGGLCILRGCMPSKTLLESANRFETLRRAGEFGLRAKEIGFAGEEIIARKRRLIGEFADYRRGQLENGRFTFVRGLAEFIDPHTIEVRHKDEESRTLTGRAFVIATGSRLNFIEIPGLREVDMLDSDRVLECPEIPKSIVILGAGAISMEFAHYYAALGSKVTVLQRSAQVMSDMDTDVANALSDAMRERGVVFSFGCEVKDMEKAEAGKRVNYIHEGTLKSVEAEEVLYALGRRARVDGLNLEAAGVELIGNRIESSRAQQTSAAHIFAAGDVTGPHEIVHIAIQQGELAARNAKRVLAGESAPLEEVDFRLRLMVVFSHPEVATIGLYERELAAGDCDYAVAKYTFDDHGKSMVMGETEGFVKLIAEKGSGVILGGAVVGPEASTLIHEIVVAMHFRATVHELARIPHYHPTLSEIWTYPAEELSSQCGNR